MKWLFGQWKILAVSSGIIAVLLITIYVQHLWLKSANVKLDTCQSNYQQLTNVRETERNGSSILQSENTKLKSERNRLKRLYNDCQSVSIAPPGNSGTTTIGQLSGKNGVPAGSLFDLAADCDYEAAKLKACQAICK